MENKIKNLQNQRKFKRVKKIDIKDKKKENSSIKSKPAESKTGKSIDVKTVDP